jgi:hypothetical protein
MINTSLKRAIFGLSVVAVTVMPIGASRVQAQSDLGAYDILSKAQQSKPADASYRLNFYVGGLPLAGDEESYSASEFSMVGDGILTTQPETANYLTYTVAQDEQVLTIETLANASGYFVQSKDTGSWVGQATSTNIGDVLRYDSVKDAVYVGDEQVGQYMAHHITGLIAPLGSEHSGEYVDLAEVHFWLRTDNLYPVQIALSTGGTPAVSMSFEFYAWDQGIVLPHPNVTAASFNESFFGASRDLPFGAAEHTSEVQPAKGNLSLLQACASRGGPTFSWGIVTWFLTTCNVRDLRFALDRGSDVAGLVGTICSAIWPCRVLSAVIGFALRIYSNWLDWADNSCGRRGANFHLSIWFVPVFWVARIC